MTFISRNFHHHPAKGSARYTSSSLSTHLLPFLRILICIFAISTLTLYHPYQQYQWAYLPSLAQSLPSSTSASIYYPSKPPSSTCSYGHRLVPSISPTPDPSPSHSALSRRPFRIPAICPIFRQAIVPQSLPPEAEEPETTLLIHMQHRACL